MDRDAVMQVDEVVRTERYLNDGSRAQAIFNAGRKVIPGGTSRQFYSFAPHPIYGSAGEGCWLTDVDGDRRIDCLNNMSALIHGHADPETTKAVISQLSRGVSYSEPCEDEVALAEMLVERAPTVEQVHFRSSGTEAVMMAIKLARAFTGRRRIAKFEGFYHGYYDYVQMSVTPSQEVWGAADAPTTITNSAGLSNTIKEEVLVLPYNDAASVERLLEENKDEIAAVLVEPFANRSGMPAPEQGFHDLLRRITRKHGILLVFDEIITFRLGVAGAQGITGGEPDLTTFGKVIGGGFPIGAVGGAREVMSLLDPANGKSTVISGGTYSANPISMAAGRATLQKLTAASIDRLDRLGLRFREQTANAIEAYEIDAQVRGVGSIFQIIPTREPVKSYRDLPAGPGVRDFYARLHKGLMRNGVIISSRGLGCLSTAMDDDVIDAITKAFERTFKEMIKT